MKLNQLGVGAARALGTAALSRAILAQGTAPTGFNTGAALVYSIDGIIRQLAAQTSTALTALATPFYTQPAGTTVYYTLAVDASGNVRTVQGTFAGQVLNSGGIETRGDGTVPDVPDFSVASTDASGNQTLATQWCPFGIIRVVNATNPFIPGTTALNAAGVTATYFDCMYLPSAERP